MQKPHFRTAMAPTLALLIASVFAAPVVAQQPPALESPPQLLPHLTMKEAAQAAVLKSPEVVVRWHAFQEAGEEVSVARGGFLPRVDANAGAGRERTTQTNTGVNPNTKTDLDYSRRGLGLTLNQMLFDGFATSNDVKRLGKAKLVRYFELLDTSENVALEAGRAYLDVVRYRQLVFLAKENYIQHQVALEQLRQRFESGVGKRADVEQAASRLALADVNLTTADANLHDVSARYVRIVGVQPPKVAFAPARLAKGMPDSNATALQTALRRNPALRATVENIESSQYDLDARRAALSPKLSLKAYSQYDHNYVGTPGNRNDTAVELVLNYNIYNGGSDVARNRQYRERKNMALDQREKVCRDMRQTLSIAYNETYRLNEQLSFISLQVDLVEKTRAAYRDQFKIGQRTLLDLLNTQNEFFDARRAQVNADNDLSIAYLRSYAGMGTLLEQLGLKRLEEESSPEEQELTKVDLAELCPPTLAVDTKLDRLDLARRSKEAMDTSGLTLGSAPAPAPAPANPVVPSGDEGEVSARLNDWRAAWVSRSIQNYLPFYASSFMPEGSAAHHESGFTPDGSKERATWERQRKQRLAGATGIAVDLQDVVVRMTGPDTAVTDFRQVYASDVFSDTTDKTLEWRKENGQWLIVREATRGGGKGR